MPCLDPNGAAAIRPSSDLGDHDSRSLFVELLCGWYVRYRIDKRKKFTWPACFLGLHPQLSAANIIRELWKNPERGLLPRRENLNWKSFRPRSSWRLCPAPSLWAVYSQDWEEPVLLVSRLKEELTLASLWSTRFLELWFCFSSPSLLQRSQQASAWQESSRYLVAFFKVLSLIF